MSLDENNLIWIDLEMTGLDRDNDLIIEIATVITDKDLNIIAEGPVIAIHQDDNTLNAMDDWNQNQHGKSGLISRVKSSTSSEKDAELKTLEFLRQYVPKGASPMCGNSIGQDRHFMHRCMPELENYFHYRNLDVSTLKELARRWAPSVYSGFTKDSNHLAMDDIKDSITELKYYRENFIRF
ncbi:MAG: oligoribonuclease [Gammaproteobacteria bacterium]|nr:MAG: oligoribonuclease [Gammaproteobacteria bacterium]